MMEVQAHRIRFTTATALARPLILLQTHLQSSPARTHPQLVRVAMGSIPPPLSSQRPIPTRDHGATSDGNWRKDRHTSKSPQESPSSNNSSAPYGSRRDASTWSPGDGNASKQDEPHRSNYRNNPFSIPRTIQRHPSDASDEPSTSPQ